MSITFFCPDAPTTKIKPYPEEEPDYEVEVPLEPWIDINMSNGNAHAFLREIDPDNASSSEGRWDRAKLEEVKARLLVLQNDPEELVADPARIGNIRMCGRDMEYVVRRINDLLTLINLTLEHNYEVCYG